MYADPLPQRVRLLVLGGGIHGVGVLHDLASRGWTDIHLVEKAQLGSGTSSRSTKLIHGGLRYLKNVRDFSLVAESLQERQVLRSVAGDLVRPLELFLPVMKGEGMPGFVLRTGLYLYDFLAGKAKIHPHKKATAAEVKEKLPIFDSSKARAFYSFWDSQTDDLALVRRVAASAHKLGAGISEGCRAVSIKQTDDGWIVDVETADGRRQPISALYVLNALGPWANIFLEGSRIVPAFRGINNEGIHLLFADMGLKAGMLLQSPADKRIFFVLPWQGRTLVGTTESIYRGDPDELVIRPESVEYLLNRCNHYLSKKLREEEILATFTGLRWLALDERRDLSSTSRSYELGEHKSQRGLLFTIYGGKLTSYRRLAESIGNRMISHFGENRRSMTHRPEYWVKDGETQDLQAVPRRFQEGGIAYNKRV